MKGAIVNQAGQLPVYGDFINPIAQGDEISIKVCAAALSPLVRGRAAGTHYSFKGECPFVAGVDGVGQLSDGRRVYFFQPKAPFGSMAEQAVVMPAQCITLPDGLDDITAAAIANPGMSSWAALTERAVLKKGETVLINGATGISGKLAVQIAKHLGAAKIIVTGRNPAALQELKELGADQVISLTEENAAQVAHFEAQFALGVDVIIDYLWGNSAELLLKAAAKATAGSQAVRFVQVGSMSGGEMTLPGSLLRSKAIVLMGSGLGSVSSQGLIGCIAAVLQATPRAGFRIATRAVPLTDVTKSWSENDSSTRTVFTV